MIGGSLAAGVADAPIAMAKRASRIQTPASRAEGGVNGAWIRRPPARPSHRQVHVAADDCIDPGARNAAASTLAAKLSLPREAGLPGTTAHARRQSNAGLELDAD